MTSKLTPNDTYFLNGAQWQLKAMDAERAWALHTGKTTTKIAIADTGGFNHDDFKDSNGVSRVLPGLNTYDGGSTDTIHPNHHGLECMGAIGATGNNGVGVAGAHWNCRLVPIKISEPTTRGWGTPESVAAGIRAGGDFGCRSLNLSWGLGDTDTMGQNVAFYQSAIDYAFERGCLTFIISGNQGLDHYLNQDQLQRCIVVGASTKDGHREPLSNFGKWVTVVAPLGGTNGYDLFQYRTIDYGTRVPSTTKLWPSTSGYTEDFWGTSATTPLTCGAEALSDIADNLTCYQRMALVKRAVHKLSGLWQDHKFSAFGQVSMFETVRIASLALPGAAPRPTVIAATPQHNSSVYLGDNDTVSFEALVFDENPVESVSLFLDGSETPYQTLTQEPYIFAWTPSASGVHTFQFKAVSASGVGLSSVDTIHVLPANSTDPPFVGIISHRSGQEVSGTIDVAAASSVFTTLVQDKPGASNPCWRPAVWIETLNLCLKQNGVEVASLPQVTTGGIWGELSIPSNITGAVTLEATAVASNGLTNTTSIDLLAMGKPAITFTSQPTVSVNLDGTATLTYATADTGADDVAAIASAAVSVTDRLVFRDAAAAIVTAGVSITDTRAVIEALTATAQASVSVTDTVHQVEQMLAQIQAFPTVTDILTVAGQIGAPLVFTAQPTMSMTTGDGGIVAYGTVDPGAEDVTTQATAVAQVSDLVQRIEGVIATINAIPSVTDVLAGVEAIVSTAQAQATVVDIKVIGIAENLETAATALVQASEVQLMVDNVTVMALAGAGLGEIAGYVETVAAAAAVQASVIDVLRSPSALRYFLASVCSPRAFAGSASPRTFSSLCTPGRA